LELGEEKELVPRRIISLPAAPHLLTFTKSGDRLLVALRQGAIVAYDTQQLISSNSDVTPVASLESHTSPAKDILPNPGSDPTHSHKIIILRVDGTIQIVNESLVVDGGWFVPDGGTLPVAGVCIAAFLVSLFSAMCSRLVPQRKTIGNWPPDWRYSRI
jgi:hypothetical protein